MDSGSALRVGILCEYATLNGGEFSLLATLDQLSRALLDPLVLCPPGPLLDELSNRGIPTVPCSPAAERGSWNPLGWTRDLNALIDVHHLQLLHANSLAMGRKLGAVATELNCPTTTHLRDIIKLSAAAIHSLNRHQRRIAVSEATLRFHLEQGLSADRTVVIHNGIDTNRWKPQPRAGQLKRELNLPADAQLAATIGQICLRKGQDDLAAAAVLLRDAFPHLHFLIVGERHSSKPETIAFDEHVSRVFAEAGMAHRLQRLAFRSDLRTIYSEVDIVVQPSRQEPFGRVLLEAAACQTPIVATHVGGTEELLAHGESAWLVPAGNPAALAKGISTLLESEELRTNLAGAARTRVMQHFSAVDSAAKLLEVWREVARTGAGSPPP